MLITHIFYLESLRGDNCSALIQKALESIIECKGKEMFSALLGVVHKVVHSEERRGTISRS